MEIDVIDVHCTEANAYGAASFNAPRVAKQNK